MADIRSPLSDHLTPGRHGAGTGAPGVVLREMPLPGLVQLAAWPDTVDAVAARASEILGAALPEDTRRATQAGATTVFRIGPERFWIVGDAGAGLVEAFAAEEAVATALGHSRTVIRVAGPHARDFLARSIAVDLDAAAFPLMSVAQTGLHHVGVLVHFAAETDDGDAFDLYIPRTFALSHWQWLTRLAEPFGYAVEDGATA